MSMGGLGCPQLAIPCGITAAARREGRKDEQRFSLLLTLVDTLHVGLVGIPLRRSMLLPISKAQILVGGVWPLSIGHLIFQWTRATSPGQHSSFSLWISPVVRWGLCMCASMDRLLVSELVPSLCPIIDSCTKGTQPLRTLGSSR